MRRANTCRIPGMVPRASYMLIHLIFVTTQKVMRKLRHRVVKSLTQGYRTRKWLPGAAVPLNTITPPLTHGLLAHGDANTQLFPGTQQALSKRKVVSLPLVT